MKCNFTVGQKVVCAWSGGLMRSELCPKKGHVYTIRCMEMRIGMVGLLFEEVVNKKNHYSNGYSEVGFDARDFRPLTSKKTDISIFTSMLTEDVA